MNDGASGSTDDTLAATRDGAAVLSEGTERVGGEDVASGRVASEDTDTQLEPGTVVGRYVVLSRLGAGGMGVVYAAYDPDLDRKVALKLLLPGTGGTAGSEGATRLLREAQALAKLSHPNVVTIHDVGTHVGRVWLAMELVAGKTLGHWCTQKRRRWSEVLDVLVRAGRGVAAAHAAGLLHRDLKPDNIMVGDDGRVRVMDFGLARPKNAGTDEPLPALEETAAQPRLEVLAQRVTQAGTLLGTPAYMAPEQFAAGELGPATDQFSFCVTLWEALYGVRPFRGAALLDLAVAVLGGKVSAPPRGGRVPAWLRRNLERGLSVEPEARWPSIEALLDALQRGQTRVRLRRGLGVAAVVAVAVAAIAGWQELGERRRAATCEAEGASIAEAWNEDARGKLRDALVGTGVSYAETTAEKVMPWLDGHASAWQAARTEACLDASVHGTWDADLLDRGLWCLDERRMELEALVAELSRADADVVAKAVTAVAGLSRVDACRDVNLLVRLPPAPSEQRGEVRAVRAELSRAEALERAGRYDEALEVVRPLAARASELGWPPLSARVWARESSLLQKTGAYEEAERVGADAYYEAARIGAWTVAARASTTLVSVSHKSAQHTEGLSWGRHAKVALAHAGDDDGPREGDRLNNLANVHRATGAFEEARALHERALAIREKALGAEHPSVAASLNNLAAVHWATGAYGEARALQERALAIEEKALGAEHPSVAASLGNLAVVHYATGAYEEARALQERALVIEEKVLGAEHPDVAGSLNNLANVHRATGAYEEARALYERALAITEKALGAEHPDVAMSLSNLAAVYRATGAYEEARGLYERALAIAEKALGAEHPDIAMSLSNLAAVHQATGAYEEARGLQERALAIQEKALGAEHPSVAASLVGMAGTCAATGDAEQRRALLERAVGIYDRHEGVQEYELDARFALADALVANKGDLGRARRLAQQARDGYRAAGEAKAEQLAEVEAWLGKHGG